MAPDMPDLADAALRKEKMKWAVCILIYLLGVLWRLHYLFTVHPATGFIYSDMQGFVTMAENFLNPEWTPNIGDTLQPPGMGLYLAFLNSDLDHRWRLAIGVQWFLSCMVPVLVALLGFELFGARVAMAGLVLASLHFPFLDYASYFLTENPFLFCLMLSAWLLVKSLRATRSASAMAWALTSGVALGLAFSFKTVAMMPALFMSLYLSAVGLKFRWRRIPLVLCPALIGMLLFLVPISIRSTRLNEGRLCLGSAGGAMAQLNGHYGNVGILHFKDEKRNHFYTWGCSACIQLGYNETAELHCGPYDEAEIRAIAWQWIREHPVDAFIKSVEHVAVLFAGTVNWPTSHTPFRRWAVLGEKWFWLFILLPACCHLWLNARGLIRLDKSLLGDLLVLMPVLAIMLAVFLTNSEPRYRVPFDGFIILLAARAYVRSPVREDGLVPAA